MPGRSRSASFEEATAELQRLELLGSLAAEMAHDLANVLQAVQGGAQLIEQAAGHPERVRTLAQMLAVAARRGSVLAERILSFARRHHGLAAVGAEPDDCCCPADVVGEVCGMLSRILEPRHHLTCQAEPGDLPALVQGGHAGLEAAVMNLAINARDAMPGGGDIKVCVAADLVTGDTLGVVPGLYARISVTDPGVGMPAGVLARAGDPFFTTKPAGQGTGLGLAGVKAFARRAGGTMRIESSEGHGTIVTLWLPASLPATVPALAPSATGID